MIEVVLAPWGYSVMHWRTDDCDSGFFVHDYDTLSEAFVAALIYAAENCVPLADLGNVTPLQGGLAA